MQLEYNMLASRFGIEFGSKTSHKVIGIFNCIRDHCAALGAFRCGLATLVALMMVTQEGSATGRETVVVPPGYENKEGEGSQFPLSGDGGRYLSVYDSTALQAVMPQGGIISAVSFRLDRDALFSRGEAEYQDIEVRMSTAQRLGFASPPFYSSYVGIDETIVFPRETSLTLSSTPTGSGLNSFDLRIPFVRPFEYHPQNGPLAIDILIFDGPSFSFHVDTTVGSSSFFALEGALNNPEGGYTTPPVARLEFQAIPEPTTWMLVVAGFVGFAVLCTLRRSRQFSPALGAFRCGIAALVALMMITQEGFATGIETVVVPPGYENKEGEGSQFPLSGDGGRYLSVYDSTALQAAMPQGGIISAVSFRLDRDALFFAGEAQYQDIEVRMSTSQRLGFASPPRYSTYVGNDETIVFPRNTPLTLSSTHTSSGLNSFDLRIPFVRPFEYHPQNGPLAIDILIFDGPSFNFHVDTTVGSSSFFALGGALNNPEGGYTTPPAVRLEFQPIPEPNTWVLVVAGFVVLCTLRRSRQFSPALGAFRCGLATLVAFMMITQEGSATGIETVVVPPGYENKEGEGSQPVLSGDGGRYLSVYASALLEPAMPQGGFITAVSFRLDGARISAIDARYQDFEVRMSTAERVGYEAPPLYSTYVGTDEAIVFPRDTPLTISSTPTGSGLNSFDLRIPFVRPFEYHPENGPLAIDILIFDGPPFDFGVDTAAGTASHSALSGAINDPEGQYFSPPVVRLEFQAIPEPTTWLLLISGFAGFAVFCTLRSSRPFSPALGAFRCGLATLVAFMMVTQEGSATEIETVVVPPGYENIEGEGSQNVLSGDGGRYLTVYASTALENPMPQGSFITAVTFRLDRDALFFPGEAEYHDIEVRMSTAPRLGFTEPPLYSTYVGADEAIVFPRNTPLTLSATHTSSGLNSFDLRIPFFRPFEYHPQNGPLTIDILIYDGPSFGFTVDTAVGSSSFFSLEGALNNPEGGYTTPPIARLEFQPIPEPTTWMLVVAGFVVLCTLRRSRQFSPALGAFRCGLATLVALMMVTQEGSATGIETVVVPPGYENKEGEGSQFPLSGNGGRYLSVYDSTALQAVMPEGGFITAVSFRLDGDRISGIDARYEDIEVRVSTAQRLGFASPNLYSSYVGSDETIVFPRDTSLSLSSTPTGSGLNSFDLRIPFVRPFEYHPQNGPLAIDILIFDGPSFDFHVDTTVGSSSFFALGGALNNSEGGYTTPPVARLEFQPIPEPTTWMLVVAGFVVFTIFRKGKHYERTSILRHTRP